MAVVGIDLGTTNTVVGVARDGHVTAIRDGDGEYLIPSVVSFHPSGSILVGRPAKERRVIDATNTIYSIKRLIGRSWNSEEVAHARARFPFEMREGPGQAALVVARKETFTLPEISAFVLRHAKALAEKTLGEPVDRAVITVPANFNDLQRAATKVAGRVAGLEVLRILNEPTAAALAYGYGKGKGERIVIYDFGGGTFDVTLLDLSGNVFEVLATAGNTFLGGDDIDVAIAERMARACMERHRVDARADLQVFERLRYYAEQLKVELSTVLEATIDVPNIGHDHAGKAIRLSFRMTRAELDALAGPMVERTFEVCQEAMGVARLSPKDFDQVVLVGGSTRLPIVRERVLDYFGRTPLDRINPDEVVAIGAAIQANALTGQERRRSVIPRPPMPAARALEGSVTPQRGKSEPPGRGQRKTDPFGFNKKAGGPASRPPAPNAEDAAPGGRRRVITGMGLGPAARSSRPPPLPERKGPPRKKGGTLGGVGNPAPPLVPTDGSSLTPPPAEEPERISGIDGQWGGTGAGPKRSSSLPAPPSTRGKAALDDDEPTLVPLQHAPLDFDPPTSPYSTADQEETKVGASPELIAALRDEPVASSPDHPSLPMGIDLLGDDEVTSADLRFDKLRLPALPPTREELGGTRVGLGAPAKSGTPRKPPPNVSRDAPATLLRDPSAKTAATTNVAVLDDPGSASTKAAAPSLAHARTLLVAPEGPAASPSSKDPSGHAPDEEQFKNATFTSATPAAYQLSLSEPPRADRPVLPLLVDVTPLSLCVETVSDFRDVIIARNTPVPCEQSRTFVTAIHGQDTALVRVGQGESTKFAENTFLGEVELSGLRQASRGEVRIVVTFSLDTDGMLNVRAADAETGKASTARLKLVGLPDADEVGRMTARHLSRAL